jgi:predicted kinase
LSTYFHDPMPTALVPPLYTSTVSAASEVTSLIRTRLAAVIDDGQPEAFAPPNVDAVVVVTRAPPPLPPQRAIAGFAPPVAHSTRPTTVPLVVQITGARLWALPPPPLTRPTAQPTSCRALPTTADTLAAVRVGTEETRLVVLRGNSASGKSSVAAGLRERFGRGLALVSQDNLRRIVLRERDRRGAANIGLIDLTARYALDAGFHVVVEGILYADHYGDMLAQLRADHRGPTHGYYLDVPFGETLTRHATKPIADDVDATQLRDWYRAHDLLPGCIETVIGADSPLNETVDRIMKDTGLVHLPAVDR